VLYAKKLKTILKNKRVNKIGTWRGTNESEKMTGRLSCRIRFKVGSKNLFQKQLHKKRKKIKSLLSNSNNAVPRERWKYFNYRC